MTGLAASLLALGPAADAQTTAPAEAKKPAASKDLPSKAYAKKAPKKDAGKSSKKTTTEKTAPAKTGSPPFVAAYGGPASAADVAQVKSAVALARQGKTSQATETQQSISDPVARKLVEWAILRSDDNGASFARYAAFITSNPSWPSISFMRRRAEAMLWQERPDPTVARTFFAKDSPLTAKGHFALGRALLAQGDKAGAQAQVRDAWHNDAFSSELETQVIEASGTLLTASEHKARMDMRLYAEDTEAGLRSASRAGGHASAIAKARIAVIKKAGNAKAQLDAVPAEARRDIGYVFSRAQWLRRGDHAA